MDENRLAARVLSKMRRHAPYVVLSGALAVLLILIIDFRNFRQVVLVAGSVAVGIGWMTGAMFLGSIDFNVFNLAVVPTIIGISIDNAVHIQHRYKEEGPGSLALVVSTTGSAAFLASATTVIGFGATITAHHLGIRSLGWLTIMGLGCAFVSSTVFFPSVLRVLEQRRTLAGKANVREPSRP
jgi:predicted RND superfamily exporter protein